MRCNKADFETWAHALAPIIGEIKCRSGLDEDLGDDDFADLVCRNDMYES